MQEEALRKQAIDDQHIALSTIYIYYEKMTLGDFDYRYEAFFNGKRTKSEKRD